MVTFFVGAADPPSMDNLTLFVSRYWGYYKNHELDLQLCCVSSHSHYLLQAVVVDYATV